VRGAIEGAGATDPVVDFAKTVEADADVGQPGLPDLTGELLRVRALAVGDHVDGDAAIHGAPSDCNPVPSEGGLAARERHQAAAEVGELVDEIEALLGVELVLPGPTRRGAAVCAAQVA
jgi:hypothetical protein